MNKIKEAKKIRNRLDKEWRLAVKVRDKNSCVICPPTILFVKGLNCHHIISKNVKELRNDVMNGILLCPLHHKWGTLSAHKNGFWFHEWLLTNRPEQYNYLKSTLK